MNRDRPTRLSPVCWLEVTGGDDEVTLSLHGEFDLASEERFQAELGLHIDGVVSRLVLDLRELTFMDSTGLRMLLTVHGIADNKDLDFSIRCKGEGPVRRVLRETGLDGVLPVVDSFGPVPATDSPV